MGEKDQLVAALAEFGVATVYEASGVDCACDPGLRPAWDGAELAGLAYPVRCHPGDNLALHRALESAPVGAVLVAQADGHLAGYWGEVMAVAAQAQGIVGLVIDGGLRDRDALRRLGFPAFCRGVAVHRTVKHVPGRVGEPVTVGRVPVRHGDVVIGDADGVLVLPHELLAATAERAQARQEREQRILEALRRGAVTLDLLGLRERLPDG